MMSLKTPLESTLCWLTSKYRSPRPPVEVLGKEKASCLMAFSRGIQGLWLIFLFDAFKGFNLKLSTLTSFLIWVAKLHGPFVHLEEGSQ